MLLLFSSLLFFNFFSKFYFLVVPYGITSVDFILRLVLLFFSFCFIKKDCKEKIEREKKKTKSY